VGRKAATGHDWVAHCHQYLTFDLHNEKTVEKENAMFDLNLEEPLLGEEAYIDLNIIIGLSEPEPCSRTRQPVSELDEYEQAMLA